MSDILQEEREWRESLPIGSVVWMRTYHRYGFPYDELTLVSRTRTRMNFIVNNSGRYKKAFVTETGREYGGNSCLSRLAPETEKEQSLRIEAMTKYRHACRLEKLSRKFDEIARRNPHSIMADQVDALEKIISGEKVV